MRPKTYETIFLSPDDDSGRHWHHLVVMRTKTGLEIFVDGFPPVREDGWAVYDRALTHQEIEEHYRKAMTR